MSPETPYARLRRRQFLAAAGSTLALAACGGGERVAPPPGKYVDVHRHVLPWTLDSDDPGDLDSVIEWMDENAVLQAIIPMAVSVGVGESVDWQLAERAMANIRAHSPRLFGSVSLHPASGIEAGETGAILARLKSLGAVGFGEFKPGEGFHIDDPACIALFKACAEVGFPVQFHLDAENCIDDPGLPGLQRVLDACPDTRFLGHGQGWWASISGDLSSREQMNDYPEGPVIQGGAVPRLLKDYPNMFGDLSANSGLNAIRRDPDFGLEFLQRFQHKLLFATDKVPIPFLDWGHFEFYNGLQLAPVVEQKIFRDNGRELFGLPVL